jgi:hypothetical protein
MLVTSDPVAEIDDALVRGAAALRAAHAAGDRHSAQRLAAWIDLRLEQRLMFRHDPAGTFPPPVAGAPPGRRTACASTGPTPLRAASETSLRR